MHSRLFIIERPPFLFSRLVRTLEIGEERYACKTVEWESFDPKCIAGESNDVVVPVLPAENEAVVEFLRRLRQEPVTSPTLAVLPPEPPAEMVECVAAGVDDYVFWPVRSAEWRHRLARLLGLGRAHTSSVRDLLRAELGLTQLVGNDPAFLRCIERIPLLARAGATVLILGETGTGKELCARAIHHLSRRSRNPFISVECGAIPDHLFENEMFGHARGAFTDAREDQKGLAAMAEGGTLFLDEIDGLSPAAQAKLLRFLQDRIYKPLGADRLVSADVLIIAASNCSLEERVRRREFRSDLFFRLNVMRLELPPLRERRMDIPLLAQHLYEDFAGRREAGEKVFSPQALSLLMAHDWPGNIRELSNVVQRAAVLAEGTTILPRHVVLSSSRDVHPPPACKYRDARAWVIASFERQYLESLLEAHRGNVTRAAVAAGKDRRALGRLLKKHGIQASRWAARDFFDPQAGQ
jgi:DNA-binding NtrC family response regulator